MPSTTPRKWRLREATGESARWRIAKLNHLNGSEKVCGVFLFLYSVLICMWGVTYVVAEESQKVLVDLSLQKAYIQELKRCYTGNIDVVVCLKLLFLLRCRSRRNYRCTTSRNQVTAKASGWWASSPTKMFQNEWRKGRRACPQRSGGERSNRLKWAGGKLIHCHRNPPSCNPHLKFVCNAGVACGCGHAKCNAMRHHSANEFMLAASGLCSHNWVWCWLVKRLGPETASLFVYPNLQYLLRSCSVGASTPVRFPPAIDDPL